MVQDLDIVELVVTEMDLKKELIVEVQDQQVATDQVLEISIWEL
jgi:hypothetical protein